MKDAILISGGSGLLGSAIVKELAGPSKHIIYLDINESNDLSEYAEKNDVQIEFRKINVTSERQLSQLSKNLTCEGVKVTAGIHCAYPRLKNWGTPFEELKEQDICQHLDMQLGSAILFSKYVINLLKTTNCGGSLIHLSSIYGVRAPNFSLYKNTDMYSPLEYSVIKAGIINLVKWLAKYNKDSNIRVNCISPGGILDNQPKDFIDRYNSLCTNIGMLNPDDISSVCAFLVSDKSRAINGQNIIVDDGWTL